MLVQKYGGATVSTPEKIKSIAKEIARIHQQDQEQVIVVVSAMGKATDELIRLAYQVSANPNRRELDMLLTTGERVSMTLMSMALEEFGCPAISFTGSQAGVFTDGSHSNARIVDLRPHRVEEEIKKNKVVVLAGFQGVNPQTKEITTLGRGGSDTTAVAMASHFKAKRCEVLKEVPGMCSADPNKVASIACLNEVSYADLVEMCFWGAKALHHRSAELADQLKVPLWIGLATDRTQGTLIQKDVSPMYETQKLLAVNSLVEIEHFKMRVNSSNEGMEKLWKWCERAGVPLPQVLASVFENGELRMMVTADSDTLKSLKLHAEKDPELENLNQSGSSVTLTGPGSGAPDTLLESLKALKAENVPVFKTLNSPRSLSFVVSPADREKALQALHKLWVR